MNEHSTNGQCVNGAICTIIKQQSTPGLKRCPDERTTECIEKCKTENRNVSCRRKMSKVSIVFE